jgi:hypothetical protein
MELGFSTREGKRVLRYAKLQALDATGRTLPAEMALVSSGHASESQGHLIRITVNDAGAHYPITIDPLLFTETTLTPMDLAPLDNFGYAVSISGPRAVIGSPLHNEVGNNAGAAYVFRFDGTTWMEEAKLTPMDLAPLDNFGHAVSMSGLTAVIGSPMHNEVGDNSGAAYAFRDPPTPCGDGIEGGDDTCGEESRPPVDAEPEPTGENQGGFYIKANLLNAGIDSNARGVAELLEEGGRKRFSVEVRKLTPGTYDLPVGSRYRARLNVGAREEGTVEFGENPPPGDEAIPLTFDPRGQTVEVAQGETTFLSVVFPDAANKAKSKGRKKGKNGKKSRIQIKAKFVAKGPIPGAEGKIAFQSDQGRDELNVAIASVPPGDYDLRVRGVTVGSIPVEGQSAKIGFSTQAKKNKLPLTFEPRGQLFEVSRDGTVILQVVLPQN